MATFTIKRGDTAPQLKIALAVAGTNPKTYWSSGSDKPDGNVREIHSVRFIMRGEDNNIVNSSFNKKYTGLATWSTSTSNKTILAYTWNSGDTSVAGTYNAEFEVVFQDASRAEGKKRTFPSTDGDQLIINVVADLNDES